MKEAWHPSSECDLCRFREALKQIEAKLLVPCSMPTHSFRIQAEAWQIAYNALNPSTAFKSEDNTTQC